MTMIDTEKLLQEISPDEPCGQNLEYDPMFQELESAATAKPAQELGDTLIPAEEPDWRKVQDLALDLLSRTKDLRIASVYLAPAVVHTGGFIGFSEVLDLICGYLEEYWDTVHPQLDPDDNLDPTSRANAIQSLNDQVMLIHPLRNVPLIKAQGVGMFSLRDIDVSVGKISITAEENDSPPTEAIIEGALKESKLDDLQGDASAIEKSLESLEKIGALLIEKVGVENAPEFKGVIDELKNANIVLANELALRGVEDLPQMEEKEIADHEAAPAKEGPITGEIKSRQDIVNMLDKICDYYVVHEPSSPIPLLLQRAKRLMSKDFMEIMKDLVSDGVIQAEKVMGLKEDE